MWPEVEEYRFDCFIHPNATIGKNVKIGPGTVIYGCVTIKDNVIIGANTTIGGSGFCFDREKSPPEREEFKGSVYIGTNVEIGNNCNIDRGRIQTTIWDGAKIDSLCHIAHDCVIGDDAIIAGGTILGGHAQIGDKARVGLNCTLRNRSVVEYGVIIGMHTPVIRRATKKKTLMA